MIEKITKCRICDNTELIPVVDLGLQYLTGVPPPNITTGTLTKNLFLTGDFRLATFDLYNPNDRLD